MPLILNEIEKIARDLINKEFELSVSFDKDAVLRALSSAIVYLLVHDLEKLWNILYRIDVNEDKVKALFDRRDATEIAPEMALLIYERLVQKAKTRIEYRDKK